MQSKLKSTSRPRKLPHTMILLLKLSALKHTNEGTNPTINKIINKTINETISKTVKTRKTKAMILETKVQTLALITIKATINVLIKARTIEIIVKIAKTSNPACRLILLGQINSVKRRKSDAKITTYALYVVSPVIVLTNAPIRQKTSFLDADLHFV